jgi:predicted enzyme related to lactoylglutathione lyase
MTNDNQSNTVNYIEIPCEETKVLRDFYTSLLGWKFEEGKDTPDYWFTGDSGVKGAILKRRNAKQAATIYINVKSIDDCIDEAKRLGANVVVDKEEISEGYYALLEDPQKNVIGIWENKSH